MNGSFEKLATRVKGFIAGGEGTFEELALAIHAFQYQENDPYRRFCELRGLGQDLSDWREIPAVPQQAFKASRMTTFPEKLTVQEFRTSGTTGEGYGSHFFRDLTLYEAAIDAGWAALGVDGLRMFVLTPSPAEAPHSSLSHMMGHLTDGADRFYLRGGELQVEALRTDVATMGRGSALLMGTALAFFNLMEKSPAVFPLPPGSRVMETGGYKGSGRSISKEDFYQQLAIYFEIEPDQIINEYGMTELSSQFYTHGLGEPHRSGAWVRARVVNPLTRQEVGMGEIGILQLFDLANVGSVLAIQTEDQAIREEDGFILLGRDPSAVARGCSRSVDDLLNP